jgi:hypothetical protein
LILLLLLIGTPTFLKGCSTDFPLFGDPQHSSSGPTSEGPANRSENNTPPSSNEPIITKEALQQKDLSIFKGKWDLITELVNDKTNEVLKLTFYFDEIGQGTATLTEKNGRTCAGSAQAKINTENSFSLEYSRLNCNNGGAYRSESATCKVLTNSAKADCMLTCKESKCDTTFQRH